MYGVDSKKWGKLNKDNEEQRKFDLLRQRKSIDFSGVTSLLSFVFKENNRKRYTGKKKKRKWKKVHRV